MDCERFDKLSLDLLYGELDELTAASARRHLHHCTRCQNIWQRLRATQEVAVVPLEEPPEDLFESILAAERDAHKKLPVRERLGRTVSVLAGYAMRPQLAMAALLFLMLGSGLVFWRSGPSRLERIVAFEEGAPSEEAAPAADESALSPGAREFARAAESPALASIEPASAAPPSESYSLATKAYQEGRYAEAERLFAEVAASDSPKAASAALLEAHAARNGSGCQRATTLYDEVSSRYRGSTVADEASFQAALCYRALGRLDRAIAHYESLRQRPAFETRAEQALGEIRASSGDSTIATASRAGSVDAAADAESSGKPAAAKAASPSALVAPAAAPAAPAKPESTAAAEAPARETP